MNLLSKGLLTKGLGTNLPATKTLLTMNLHLFVMSIKIGGGSGGSIPLGPGEIHNFYQPVVPKTFNDIDPSILNHPIFVGDQKAIKKFITVVVKFGDKEIEKEYMVSLKQENIILRGISIINATNSKLRATIKDIKTTKQAIIAKITNFNKKNK